jgi:hypothetical protein
MYSVQLRVSDAPTNWSYVWSDMFFSLAAEYLKVSHGAPLCGPVSAPFLRFRLLYGFDVVSLLARSLSLSLYLSLSLFLSLSLSLSLSRLLEFILLKSARSAPCRRWPCFSLTILTTISERNRLQRSCSS